MTKWQWRVVMALVRYILHKENIYYEGAANEELRRNDMEVLEEAGNRHSKRTE